MSLIEIDENRWPILIITLSGEETGNDVRIFLDKIENYQSKNEDFCFILDLREINRLSPEVRDKLVSWLRNADFRELAGTAIVLSSPMMRLYLSVGLWFTKVRDPRRARFTHSICDTMNEAYEWSTTRLQIQKPVKQGKKSVNYKRNSGPK